MINGRTASPTVRTHDGCAKGMQGDSLPELVEERADYVVFNGSVGALTGDNALKVDAGDTVRLFFGVGGPNVISSFHIIGEIFDQVYPEGALGEPHRNVQSTLVPAGGALFLVMGGLVLSGVF